MFKSTNIELKEKECSEGKNEMGK